MSRATIAAGRRRSTPARPVLIPEEYVPDLNVRLSLYRRLSEAERVQRIARPWPPN